MTEYPNASAADSELILHLYDLRRETEMRKARRWIENEFWPRDWDDLQRVVMAYGTPENTYFRQVYGYWEMACAIVARGGLHAGLFFDTCHEAWFVYAKVKPFLAQARAAVNSPEFLRNMERQLEGTPEGRERLQRIEENIAKWLLIMEQKRAERQSAA